MLEYEDFYDLAVYTNEIYKGCYTPKEIACNAYNYYSDFQAAKREGLSKSLCIYDLLMRLLEDNESDGVVEWAYRIANEIANAREKVKRGGSD